MYGEATVEYWTCGYMQTVTSAPNGDVLSRAEKLASHHHEKHGCDFSDIDVVQAELYR